MASSLRIQGTDRGTFYLEMRTFDWKQNHTWGNSHKPSEFYGLDLIFLNRWPGRFVELRREPAPSPSTATSTRKGQRGLPLNPQP